MGTALLFFVFVAVAWRRLRTIDDAADVPQVQIQLLRSSPSSALSLHLSSRVWPAPWSPWRRSPARPHHGGRFRRLLLRHRDGRVSVTKQGRMWRRWPRPGLRRDRPHPGRAAHGHGGRLTDVSLYSLEKEPFVLALTGHAPAARAADDMVAKRLEELEAL